MNPIPLNLSPLEDSQLVERHLAGDRGAFAEIVARHQAMVCALTLSACGDIGRSEDLAQEVFVTAWKKLPELREPEKLRGWLCGIARNLAQNSWRRQERTPTARAEELPADLAGGGNDPREQAISAEEGALLWRLLEDIPPNYREPLVLYYREECSAAAVATALEISEDTVRQRLARGRALLSERMTALLEESLRHSAPTAAFGIGVLVLLPLGLGPGAGTAAAAAATASVPGGIGKGAMAAGTVGAAAVKSGAGIKLLASAGVLPALLSGLAGTLDFRTRYDAAQTPEARRLITRAYAGIHLGIALGIVGVVLWSWTFRELTHAHVWLYAIGLVAISSLPTLIAGFWTRRQFRRLALVAPALSPAGGGAADGRTPWEGRGYEYRSERCLLGLPLVHVRTGGKGRGFRNPVKAWIAIGDVAFGVLFAGGGFAFAPMSIGGITVGLLSSGGLALGGFALGGIAIGAMAVGGVAVGLMAFGGVAVGIAAKGGVMIGQAASPQFEHIARNLLTTSVAGWSLAWLPPLLFIAWHRWRTRAAR